jgi:hypothetical protein
MTWKNWSFRKTLKDPNVTKPCLPIADINPALALKIAWPEEGVETVA